jgi:hypothetical protein
MKASDVAMAVNFLKTFRDSSSAPVSEFGDLVCLIARMQFALDRIEIPVEKEAA